MQLLSDLAKVTITLFIVLDPVGLTPFLYTVTAHKSPAESRRIIYRVAAGATILLRSYDPEGRGCSNLRGHTAGSPDKRRASTGDHSGPTGDIGR